MTARVRERWMVPTLAVVMGAAGAFALVPLLACTSAIAAPHAWFAWSGTHGLTSWSLLTWNTLVVFGLAVALPLTVSWLVLFSRARFAAAASLGCVALGVLLGFYVLVPWMDGAVVSSPFALPWWQHGLECSLLLTGAAGLLGRRPFARVMPERGSR
jgi:hypothetical protein